MNKYDLAAIAEIEGLTENRKLTASQQRELFGFNVFGRLTLRFDLDGQGEVTLMRRTCNDSIFAIRTLDEVVEAIQNQRRFYVN